MVLEHRVPRRREHYGPFLPAVYLSRRESHLSVPTAPRSRFCPFFVARRAGEPVAAPSHGRKDVLAATGAGRRAALPLHFSSLGGCAPSRGRACDAIFAIGTAGSMHAPVTTETFPHRSSTQNSHQRPEWLALLECAAPCPNLERLAGLLQVSFNWLLFLQPAE